MLTSQSAADSDQESCGGERQQARAVERAYQLKLQACQEGQQRQAQLVHRLQNKVPGTHRVSVHGSLCVSGKMSEWVSGWVNVCEWPVSVAGHDYNTLVRWVLCCYRCAVSRDAVSPARCFSTRGDVEIWRNKFWRKHQSLRSSGCL